MENPFDAVTSGCGIYSWHAGHSLWPHAMCPCTHHFEEKDRQEVEGVTLDFHWGKCENQEEEQKVVSSKGRISPSLLEESLNLKMELPSKSMAVLLKHCTWKCIFLPTFTGIFPERDRLYLLHFWEKGCSKALHSFSQEERILWNTKSASGKYLCLVAVATHPQVRLAETSDKPEMPKTVSGCQGKYSAHVRTNLCVCLEDLVENWGFTLAKKCWQVWHHPSLAERKSGNYLGKAVLLNKGLQKYQTDLAVDNICQLQSSV